MRVILAEDSALLRQGLARLMEDHGITVVAQRGDAEGLVELVATTAPDVVVLDIRMPPTHTDEGLRAARAIRLGRPGTGVLLLSQYVETGSVLEELTNDGQGVGYLLKERVTDARELFDALRRVACGECVIDPEVVARLMRRPRPDRVLDTLTPREREVLALMAEGRSNDGISACLHIAAKTLETHVRSIFTKLHLEPDPGEHRRVRAVLAYLQA
ncbi:LuxR C-terminal-related transcriptional regulator [Streptomyces sp. NPDC093546]|uniref:response regulator transcription factor n=1 Tax=Streptomyces sp. NPDC093546 TaxID=3366040 RepID=UPI00382F54BA